MRRYLVVAHKTLDSAELLDALRDRAAEGSSTFHLVVPVDHGGGLTWTEGDARAAAERRLESARLSFTAEGLAVTGEIGDPSPVEAVRDVLQRVGPGRFDEVIVSTLPQTVSRWLKLDAPRRIERATGLQVTHLVGHPAHVA